MPKRYAIVTAPKRDSRHWKQGEVTWDEIKEWMDAPAGRKEAGNYVLGELKHTEVLHPDSDVPCSGLHRRKEAVSSRSMLSLDVDSPDADFLDTLDRKLPWQALAHTTWRATPDEPRYRLIVPTDRDMLPDEYAAAAGAVMERLGAHQFDPGSVQPERYMFKPSAPNPDWFVWHEVDGPIAPVEELLAEWNPDLSTIPMPKPSRFKRNPFELAGAVGAFNRAYDFETLIPVYNLPYEASSAADRWHLIGAGGAAGLGVVSDGLVYSHHTADPAAGSACSAFDLVRLHRFGHLDDGVDDKVPVNKRPSHQAMLDLAATDPRVVAEMVGVDFAQQMSTVAATASTSPASQTSAPPNSAQSSGAPAWRTQLQMNPRTGKFIDNIANWDLIRKHDEAFTVLRYNELSLAVETTGDLPWRDLVEGKEAFTTVDRAALAHYLERTYGVRVARTFLDELIETDAHQRSFNPVVDYLNSLTWDGEFRVEECLPGVRHTPYTRMVSRKAMVAAVARALKPGIKWDHVPVLYGSEGLGKTYWLERMFKGYTATMGDLNSKDTLITMQRAWAMLADEGHSLRKSDSDVRKEFITRSEDVFRMPYDRESQVHRRHCVIWGTTNDEVFLRAEEGNRRFLIVRCEERVDFDKLTDEYVDQVWAEAVHLYHAGELLFLEDAEALSAASEREAFTEESALVGVLSEHLDTLVPEGFEMERAEARRQFFSDHSMGLATGTEMQMRTCSAQLWVEALGRRFGEHRRVDLLEITAALKEMPGWRRIPGRHRVTGYGLQVVFERHDEDLI